MAIVRERQVEEQDTNRELILVGDTVRLVDSPLDRLKKGAKGKVIEVNGDLTVDPHALLLVQFKVAGAPFQLSASASRFRFSKHPKEEELPDAENVTPLTAAEAEEA